MQLHIIYPLSIAFTSMYKCLIFYIFYIQKYRQYSSQYIPHRSILYRSIKQLSNYMLIVVLHWIGQHPQRVVLFPHSLSLASCSEPLRRHHYYLLRSIYYLCCASVCPVSMLAERQKPLICFSALASLTFLRTKLDRTFLVMDKNTSGLVHHQESPIKRSSSSRLELEVPIRIVNSQQKQKRMSHM